MKKKILLFFFSSLLFLNVKAYASDLGPAFTGFVNGLTDGIRNNQEQKANELNMEIQEQQLQLLQQQNEAAKRANQGQDTNQPDANYAPSPDPAEVLKQVYVAQQGMTSASDEILKDTDKEPYEQTSNQARKDLATKDYKKAGDEFLDCMAASNKSLYGLQAAACYMKAGDTDDAGFILEKLNVDPDIRIQMKVRKLLTAIDNYKAATGILPPEVLQQELTREMARVEQEQAREKAQGQQELIQKFVEAANAGDTDIVRSLIEKGADINAKNNVGATALMIAARYGNTDAARLLIDKGADVNAKNNVGATALMIAARYGNTDAARLLIDKGADVNAKNNGGATALMIAARYGNADAARLLIDKGADVNAKTNNGKTVLMYAAHFAPAQALHLIGRLLRIHKVAQEGHADVVRLLIDKGADINAKDKDGCTAYMCAKQSRNYDIRHMLRFPASKE